MWPVRGAGSGRPSPLSGRPGGAGKQVLAVKIDNTGSAQPHTGLFFADVVYVEEVEWGLTRLLALFSSELPERISPVRSARVSDVSLLEPFGRVAFAFSGAQEKLLPLLADANVIDVSEPVVPWIWGVDSWRPVAWNSHALDPRAALAAAPEAAVASDVGFRFSSAVPRGGESVRSASASWDDAQVGFVWDAGRQGFVVEFDGVLSQASEGGPQLATTVVFQSVAQSESGFGDRYGGKTPLLELVGSGDAVVLRDGQVWRGSWSRASQGAPTEFFGPDGKVFPFAQGQVWVVLLEESRPLSVQSP